MAKKRTSSWDPVTAEDRKEMDELLKPLESVNPQDLVKKINEENEKYNQDLRAKAKTPEQLTVGLECVVEEANFYQSTGQASGGTVRYGGSNSSYKTGHFLRTELSVKGDSLVQKLEFKGWPPLEAGDTIKVYILKGKQEPEKSFGPSCHDPFNQGPRTHLVERDYQPIEHPSKIEKLRNGLVVATYHNQ